MFSGVIHTNSTYAPDLSINIVNNKDNIDALYNDAIDYLKEQERHFYHQFFDEADDIDTFIQLMRELLNKNENDINCLKSFANYNLSTFMPDAKPRYFEQGHRIILKGEAAKIDCNFTGKNIQSEGAIYIDIIPQNAQRIKHLLNVGLGRENWNVGKFDESNNKITRNLVKMLEQKRFGDLFTIEVANQKPGNNSKLQEFDITTVSKYEYTKENLDILFKDPTKKDELSRLRMEARKSINKMKEFIYSKMGGTSLEFQEAVKETWKEIFPSMGEDVLLRNFFFEGENYTKALLGQNGEFFNQVLTRYMNKISPKNKPMLSQIIGSNIKGGQQPRSDLQIMLACGAQINFQTKNIDADTTQIETNTSAELISKNFGVDLIDPLVNFYANASYESTHRNIIPDIENFLSSHFFQAMNLNIREGLYDLQNGLGGSQTNTFYFIGGNNIVPASEIVQHLMGKTTKPRFTISGGRVSNVYTDTGYAMGNPPNYIFLHYWKYPKGRNSGEMEPWDANEPNFRKAASSISISTSFSVNALLNSGRFELFDVFM